MITTAGPTLRPGDSGYDAECGGFNSALDAGRPAVVVGATGADDVSAALRYAAGNGLAVAVRATGHGISTSLDGRLLISTRRMRGVTVDPAARTARVQAGTIWQEVLDATAPYGLAPLSGSNPGVGVVGYTLGGGIGPLGRRHGFAADHVRGIDVVTPDGQLRRASAEQEPELFWGLRGGKDNFGVVVAMDIALVPVASLLGGGLYFTGQSAPDVLRGYAAWTATVPEEMSSSVQLIRYPDLPVLPEPLRGRSAAVLRVIWSGPPEQGEDWVRPLRGLGPLLLDSVRVLPFRESGSIHHEPPGPLPAYDRNSALREFDGAAAAALLSVAGPDTGSPVIVEIRHQGGAYSRTPAVPNAVGGRDAEYLLFSTQILEPGHEEEAGAAHALLHDTLRPWGTGGSFVNFFGVHDATPERVRTAYRPADHARLTALKALYDPANLLRANFNIPPAPAAQG